MSFYLTVAILALAPVQTTAPAAPNAPPAADRRICKRMAATGSLVRRRKECRTKAEWDLIASAARENGQDMVDRNSGRPSGM